MILAIVKGLLIFVVLMFGFVAIIKACWGQSISTLQNLLWESALAAFITLQWLIP
jgi:hypothetical protein